jgi:hypothetical protein
VRLLAIVLAGSSVLLAHDPVTTKLTWSAEISRIVYRRCAGCHREGGSAPMALTDYQSVRPWAKAIRDEVLSRRMPPWGAVKGFGDFRNDRSLQQDEMNRIAEWVEGGAPEGNPIHLPRSLPEPDNAAAAPPGVPVQTTTLRRRATVLAIRPLVGVAGAKITAVRPDGSVEPLLWLLNYRTRDAGYFEYREPVTLPAGTRIVSPVPVELLVKPRKQAR